MLTDQHPITPPPELVREWAKTCSPYEVPADHIATQAARWGADQELEACCEWLSVPCPSYGRELRAARRPKPPSLAEEALEQLRGMEQAGALDCNIDAIHRALERLKELENNG